MRCAWRALAALALAAGLVAGMQPAAAQQGSSVPSPPTTQPATLLLDSRPSIDAQELGSAWVDPHGTTSFEQVLKGGLSNFHPTQPQLIYNLGEQGALWLHYRLVRGRTERDSWVLVLPMPLLDSVTVYQQDARWQWSAESAGDTMAVSKWADPGRYPHFRLELPQGEPRDVYVRIRHLTAANFPVQLQTDTAFDQRIQVEYLGLGLTLGALVLLIAACLAQCLVYRDSVYGWYALYALISTLAVCSYTGVAAHLIWPDFGALGDAHQGSLALLAGAAALLFVRNLIGISGRHPWLDRFVFLAGVGGLAMAIAYPFVPRTIGLAILAAYVSGATVVNLWVAFEAWRRGDVVGAWVMVAYLPLTAAVLLALARLFGWVPVFFGTQYAIVVAMAIEVPLLLVALNLRSRERHGAQIRELALSTQDALTGLLAPHLFHDRLLQIVARHKRDKDHAAIVFIDLVNYPRIKEHFGSAVAEQSLLRSVIKLRRLLRDVDTVSRIGEARFGLILEGVTSRIAVTDRAARLIAAGLMPLTGLKPDVTLQFHIGAVLLDERSLDAPELVEALDALLANMSPRTRRPIRFLEPETTEPAPLETGPASLLPEAEDSVLPSTEPSMTGLSRTATRH